MNITLAFGKTLPPADSYIYPSFSKKNTKGESVAVLTHLSKEDQEVFTSTKASAHFKGDRGTSTSFTGLDGSQIILWGLGEKKSVDNETLRREVAKAFKSLNLKKESLVLCLDSFNLAKGGLEKSTAVIAESLSLADYKFEKYLSQAKKTDVSVTLYSKQTAKKAKLQKVLNETLALTESVNVGRDFVNEPPNFLTSETYAKEVEKDIKTNLKGKGVRVKILGKADLKREKMGMFLSVNNGSHYEPRLVHLTYTPKKVTSKTKHIALVGKGLVFDTGGLSLKPSNAIINMKFDMAGSATVYAAFRAAALLGVNAKVSCFLGMTDNAIGPTATYPDTIVKARNGKTVEILNTDAEGRLVLGDVLDYACDQKPDCIVDAATLTGSMLVALGTEVCGVFSNDDKLSNQILKSAKNTDEYFWSMPIIEEFRTAMKGSISDLRNISSDRWGGSSKAAAFLENFVQEGVSWAHLDIAGVGDSQTHLPYCPPKGASGVGVRTLVDFIQNA